MHSVRQLTKNNKGRFLTVQIASMCIGVARRWGIRELRRQSLVNYPMYPGNFGHEQK